MARAVGYIAGGTKAAPVNPDRALIDQSSAVWSGTYDPAKVAALYATDAVFQDTIAGETSTGLPTIQAKIADYLTNDRFVTKPASAPIRIGDSVAAFITCGTNGIDSNRALGFLQLKDGKIVRHTVYAMP